MLRRDIAEKDPLLRRFAPTYTIAYPSATKPGYVVAVCACHFSSLEDLVQAKRLCKWEQRPVWMLKA